MKLSPEEGAARLDVLPGLPLMDPLLRRQLQVGQLCQPLQDERLEELASLVADPKSPSCANPEQARQLLDRAFSGPEGATTVSRLFQLRQQRKAFGEAWAVLHHGEEAGPAWRHLPDDAALAQVVAARQPGEKLLDLARFYRTADQFQALLPLVRAESEEVGLEAIGQALENERNPLETFRAISPPILDESLPERLEAFRSLPPDRADRLYTLLAGVLETSDDLVASSRALAMVGTIGGQAERILTLVAQRRARGELRRPLQALLSTVAEALVQNGGSLSPEAMDEALARAAVTGIRETDSHVLVGGVTLQRKS